MSLGFPTILWPVSIKMRSQPSYSDGMPRVSATGPSEAPTRVDLVDVLTAAGNRAIFDLARNPLLLTIICLAHRIDAVLPDQRVVLYRKCTETLLNTWHTWKYLGKKTQSRAKVEKHNRSRMEAIGHWMQCQVDAQQSESRAIVGHDELLAFLSGFIRDDEQTTSQQASSEAGDFLEFVKSRTGLMTEVGQGQYSFVHLTFQEYLAANYLRKSGELGGMQAVWKILDDQDCCADSRWHEVIRLLLGSLERIESQEFFLERILLTADSSPDLEYALLVGGCLLDSVEAAEKMSEQILSMLLQTASQLSTSEELGRCMGIIRDWLGREPGNHQLLAEVAEQVGKQTNSTELRITLALDLISLGWSAEEAVVMSNAGVDSSSRANKLLAVLFGATNTGLAATDEEFCESRVFISHSLQREVTC